MHTGIVPDYFVCTGGADTFIELASGPQQAGHESVMSESLVAPKKTNFGAPVEHQEVNFFRKNLGAPSGELVE